MGDFKWDDTAIEVLRRMWTDGKSAGQIARQLDSGDGKYQPSRNAVIGKIHRLGLPGRLTTVRDKCGRKPKPKQERRVPSRIWRIPNDQDLVGQLKDTLATMTYEELFIPIEERKTILTVGPRDCRWPIGDPQDADNFHLCGKTKLDTLPYCEHHARRAFQPQQRRTGREYADLQRAQRERKLA